MNHRAVIAQSLRVIGALTPAVIVTGCMIWGGMRSDPSSRVTAMTIIGSMVSSATLAFVANSVQRKRGTSGDPRLEILEEAINKTATPFTPPD